MLAVVGIFGASKASAAENGLRFEGIRDTTIEAKSSFSTVKGIKGYDENNNQRGFSVYYKGKKVGSTNYIKTNKVTKKGQYQLLRYELRSGNKVKNIHRKIYIKDRTAPKFYGISNTTINFGSKFSIIKGISARDNVDGRRGYSVYIANKAKWYKVGKRRYVNTKKAGKYYLKYVVKDRSGNTTTKRRTITVKSKIVKTKKVVKKTTPNTFKPVNTVHIYPKRNDERGWWYMGLDQSRLFIHSARGENLAKIKPNSRLIKHVNGTTYE